MGLRRARHQHDAGGLGLTLASARRFFAPRVPAELVLVHPFRDGNGRCARLLAVLMGLQASLPVLDFTGVRGEERARYIAAVHAALDRNYEPMTAVFRGIIARTQARA